MSWFRRVKDNIVTKTSDKKPTPDGLWFKCGKCKTITPQKDFVANLHVCPECGKHHRLDSEGYFDILFDRGKFLELNPDLTSGDPLSFKDNVAYTDRIAKSTKKSGLKDAVRTASGKINKRDWTIACMDFGFIGGSMGSVVGEKIGRAIDYAYEKFEVL